MLSRAKPLALITGILALVLAPARLCARDTSIAVIVNPGNTVQSISLAQLRNIFLGTQTFWKDGTQVVAIVRAPSARERDVLLRRVLHMSEAQYQQYWRKKRQAHQGGHEPIAVVSNGMEEQIVLRESGAIALAPVSDLHPGIKVLRVAGHLPGSASYPLKTPLFH
jgi:hypothetical protein